MAGEGARGQVLYYPALKGLVYAPLVRAFAHRALHGLHKAAAVAAAPDHVRAQGLGGVRVRLRPAAADGALGVGVALHEVAERLAGFAPALRRDGAGVDDDDVGFGVLGGGFVSALAQQRLHGLGLVLVDLAAECVYNVFHDLIPRR